MNSQEKDQISIIIVVALYAFALGYLTASVLLDNRKVTEEEMYELNQPQYYE
jgi:flagellar basal body-associated protein FliL